MSEPFRIRRIRASDLDRIQEIEVASFGEDAYDRKLFAEYFRRCGGFFLGVGKGRNICGYMLTCMRADAARAEVISLAVEPKARQKGAASALMRSTLRRLRLRGVPRVDLMVKVTNRPAQRFYRRFGFVPLKIVPAYYEDGRAGIRMVLSM